MGRVPFIRRNGERYGFTNGLPRDFYNDDFPKGDWELYSKTYNLRYFRIAKCANTSMSKSVDFLWTHMDEIPEDAKTAVVLREPFSRCVSCFVQTQALDFTGQKKYRCRDISREALQQIYRNENPVDEWNAYLDEIEANGFWDRHQCPQLWFIDGTISPYHRRREEQVDIWLQLENLARDLHQKISPKIRLRHDNAKPAGIKKKYKEAAKQCMDRIKQVYADDFALYARAFGNGENG